MKTIIQKLTFMLAFVSLLSVQAFGENMFKSSGTSNLSIEYFNQCTNPTLTTFASSEMLIENELFSIDTIEGNSKPEVYIESYIVLMGEEFCQIELTGSINIAGSGIEVKIIANASTCDEAEQMAIDAFISLRNRVMELLR